MPQPGKFIVLEGLSGSTKSTQLALLKERFLAVDQPVTSFKFPQYNQGAVGHLIKDYYLKGTFGDPMTIHPKLASLPFLVDRLRAIPEIQHVLSTGAMAIADRWWPTNAAYQGAKLPQAERAEFFRWLEEYEFDDSHMLREDVGIYLRTTPAMSLRMVELRATEALHEGRDGQEKTDQSQVERFDCYEACLVGRPNWHTVECLDEHGQMRTREEIHADICKVLGL